MREPHREPTSGHAAKRQDTAQNLANATRNQIGKPDISIPTMMACAQQQQRVNNEMRRLKSDDETWTALLPTLERTMLLKAMPVR